MTLNLGIYKHASFFKVLLFDYSSKLMIPKKFVKKYGEIMAQGQEALLITDDEYGKCWKVKMESHDDRLCFADNWPEFVNDNKLSDMDFLVFKLVGKSTFHVAIYDKEGILKEPCSPDLQLQSERDEETECILNKSFTAAIKKDSKYRMRIPPDFSRRMGPNLPNPVFLKVATGPTMEVELVQSTDGQTMLQKGWREFRERNSIDIGNLLVFEYNVDKSEFNVVVFDKRDVEINYPVDTDYKSKRATNKEPNLGDGSKDEAQNQENTTWRDDEVIEISSSCELDSKSKLHESSSEENWDGMKMQGAVAKETSVAYHKAMDFVRHNNPNNNPSFISLLQQSYVSGGFVLNVPLSFARRNFPHVGSVTIIMVMGVKKWQVRCTVRNRCTQLSAGWKQFVRDNGLKVGDACVFQVADDNNKKHVWNVAIFRSCD